MAIKGLHLLLLVSRWVKAWSEQGEEVLVVAVWVVGVDGDGGGGGGG